MALRALFLSTLAILFAAPSLAQTPAADPGAPLSGYPRKALGLPTAAELKTATYVRDVIYGHRDGMALTYDVFKPLKPNGALVVNMVSAGWYSSWGPPQERQALHARLLAIEVVLQRLDQTRPQRGTHGGHVGGDRVGQLQRRHARIE